MPASLLAALALLAAPAPAQKAFGIDDLLAVPRVAAPALSPDGKLVAFTVGRPSADGSKLDSALWVVSSAGGEPRRLTSAAGEQVSSPRFSPDGRRIAFVSTRSGSSQAWLIPLEGGEALQATQLASEVNELLWAPDGQSLLVTSDVDPTCGADLACGAARAQEANGQPRLATRLLFRHWSGWRERLRTHVLAVPLAGAPSSSPVSSTRWRPSPPTRTSSR